MSRDDFDDVDRALADGLGGLAPVGPNGDDVLESVRPRLRRARTRARAARAGGTLIALLVVGSVAVFAAPHSGHVHVTVGSGSTAPGSTRRIGGSSTSTSTTAPAPGVHAPTPSTTRAPARNGTTGPGAAPATTPGAAGRGGGPGPSGAGRGNDGPATTPAPSRASPDASTRTYQATGGSIRVRLAGNAPTLDTVSPAAGYDYTVHDNGPTRVEVRFTRAGREVSRIDVEVEVGHLVRVEHGS